MLDVLIGIAKAPAKRALHEYTRWRHPGRRRAALQALGERPGFSSVLFVCLGNVCRSPYAEVSFRRMAEAAGVDVTIESAGFIGPGRSSPEQAQAIAGERSLDLGPHVSKLLDEENVGGADLVVVVDPQQPRRLRRLLPGLAPHVLVLGDLDPQAGPHRRIPDPWGRDDDAFRAAFERIDRCLEALLPFAAGAVQDPLSGEDDPPASVGEASL